VSFSRPVPSRPASPPHPVSLIAACLDLVLPVRCAGCGRAGHALCPACLPAAGEVRTRWLRGLRVAAAASYDGAVRAAVLGWKERGRGQLARPLAVLLARSLGAVPDVRDPPAGSRTVLVPVPPSASARRARGGDVLARLTVAAGSVHGVRTVRGALALDRAVRDSVGLGRRDREENLRGAFAARPAPPGLRAVLVDDVVTTGTTLREAALALREQGWPVVGAAVVAETPAPAARAGSARVPLGRVVAVPLAGHSGPV